MTTWADGTTTARAASFLESSLLFPTDTCTLFVSGSGSDSNSGRGPGQPMRTLAAAYAALPAPVGTNPSAGVIWCAPGRYDVGAGLALTRGKPVHIRGLVPTPRYVNSGASSPLPQSCAIIYTSTGAASMITTIAGTAATAMDGLLFEDLLFEFSNSATLIGIDANSCRYGAVNRCYFYAQAGSAVTAQGFFVRDDVTYGGAGTDASWWRFDQNWVQNMALGTCGRTSGNCNHQLFTRNHGFGNARNASALPFITIVNGNRCAVRDTNMEAYHQGILFADCWECQESGAGGEFVDVLIDVTGTHNCRFAPNATSNFALGSATPLDAGALIWRGDATTKANIIDIQATWTAGNTAKGWQPTDDGTNPAISLGHPDNIVNSPRYSTDPMKTGGTSTTTPGAVATVNIPHGLGTTPVKYSVQAANANARTALLAAAAGGTGLGMYVTVDATNVILNFSGNLIAATSYAWAWTADAR